MGKILIKKDMSKCCEGVDGICRLFFKIFLVFLIFV